MTPYRSFHIADDFKVYHNGRQIFRAFWQRCDSLEAAQRMIDQSLACEKIARMRPSLDRMPEFENETGDDGKWMQQQAELQLKQREDEY